MGLKIIRHYVIECDGECGAEVGGQTDSLEAVQEAARLGWSHLPGEDGRPDLWLCPSCRAAMDTRMGASA